MVIADLKYGGQRHMKFDMEINELLIVFVGIFWIVTVISIVDDEN